MSKPLAAVVTAVTVAAVATLASAASAQAPDSAAFVTRLGVDTIAVERFVRVGRRIEAEVVLRIPSTTRTRYELELFPNGDMMRLETVTEAGGREVRRETVTRIGDSLQVVTTTDDGDRTRSVAAADGTLPFIDMVHWPFEIALQRVTRSGADEASVPLLAGRGTLPFRFAVTGPDAMTITHPTRGTMEVRVDSAGRLLSLDAGATTRKLVVERHPWASLDEPAREWAAADAAGRGLGALSGRGNVEAIVAGATITVDYGTPSKRGREIWGALVPYGDVWRTGANQATHFTTDRDLLLGVEGDTLQVPAGSYTLFSIPDAGGGMLIVNTQTGQTGTAYDPARDLGRVPLAAQPLDEEVEVFTIAVSEDGAGGLLRLQWDRTELVVPFVVRATEG